MRSRDPFERRLRRLRPARPSAELKRRVMRQASRLPSQRPSPVERLWFSRPLRAAAAAIVVAATLFSIVEDRLLARRLESAFGTPRVGSGDGFAWVTEELGLELGARGKLYRTGSGAVVSHGSRRALEAELLGGDES